VRDDFDFIRNALQYYATARFAAHARFLPVSGNLFHHAIEMSLKAGLVRQRSLRETKNFWHELEALWQAFKMDYPDPAIERHDATIATLDKFRKIRYPEADWDMGMQLAWSGPPVLVTMGDGVDSPEQYVVVVNDVDNLIVDVLKACSWNPPALITMSPAAREAINRNNPHSQFLTNTPPG